MRRLLLGFAQVCLLTAAQPHTPEWALSEDAKALTKLPRTLWLKDGTLLLEDLRKPEKERFLERLDPATGLRKPALDTARALASLKALLGEKEAPAKLPWPEGVDDRCRRALVQVGEAFLLLDLPTATFTRLPAAKAASLSPDGTRAAFVRDQDLYVVDLDTRAEKRLTLDASATVLNGTFSWVYWEELYGHRDEAFWWSPDSRGLAFLRSDESAVPLHSFTDFQPHQARVVTQRYPQAGQPNPAVRLGLASADTGAVTWMALPEASYEYVANVTWLPGGDRVAVQTLNRGQDTLDLHLVDWSGKVQTVLREQNPDGVHFYEPRFLKDGKHFLWASDRTGYNHLYRYTLDGKLVNPVTQGEWSLTPWGDDNGATGLQGVDGGWAYFTCQASGSVERQVWKAKLDGSGLKRVTAEDGTHAPAFSPDFRYFVDTWSSVTRPPSLALRKADGTVAQVLAEARDGKDLVLPSLFTLPAADGLPLPARVSKPRNFDPARRYPVIFYVYGGPSAPSVADRWGGGGNAFDQVLLEEGYVVVSVDNRSSAAIGRKYEAANRLRLYGDVEVNDLLAGVRWVKAQPWADPERVGVWGWSGGGTYTLAALTHTREFKAGIAVAPVSDWRFYDSYYTELVMKRPEDNPDGYKATSQVEAAKDLHGRLLLVHGTHDDNVHPQNSQAFMDALIASGKLFDTMVYPMRKHGIADKPATLHLYRTMVEFWKKNL
jgi:dipeptidyl-peptidase 4